ncbi:MAG: hypothetical protein JXO48_03310 [Deltaproteobacteria bacterium]|nr:hypothetical protein [Deltaproteobacteria bacterium]
MDQDSHYIQSREDEIELIDLLRVIWKWKWMIVIGTFLCVVAAVVLSYQLPKVYLVDMIIEPGIMGVDEKGSFIYLDSPENISRKIDQQAYNQRIVQVLNIDPREVRLDINADVDRKGGSQVIRVTSQWEEEKVGLGVNVLTRLVDLLTNDYQAIVQQKKLNYDSKITTNKNKIQEVEIQRKDLEKQIQIKMSDIQSKQNQMRVKQERLESVRQQVEKLLLELKQVKDNSEKIAAKRNELITESTAQDDLSLMLYGTTLQQNIIYFNELSTQIYDLRDEQHEIESEISLLEGEVNMKTGEAERLRLQKDEGVRTKIDDITAEIERLRSEKDIITNIKVVKTPEISVRPVKPKKKQIVALAGAGSLFFFLLLAFFIEYVRNAQRQER